MGLGVPFNIASYALLTYIIAHVCGYEVGEFVHCMGDSHVYVDHIEPLKEQIQRIPFEFPILKLKTQRLQQGSMSNEEYCDALVKQIENIQYEDLELLEYQSHGKVTMKMSV
jgi:thymidylate synthase